ncbi:MAG TPA: RIP metalloprotease RseP [Aestuariivirga sp.]|nr:RIP metalloprotease RseP [Aestuariivirga sp.]
MEFLSYAHLPFGYLLPFIAALTIIVFIHELGHFLVARWCGVAVEVFSIGFGREIFGWNDKHGTRWKVCWLPLGGYVKFEGDANPTSLPQAEPDSEMTRTTGNFHGKPVWKRAAVVAAGPIANFILSILIFASVFAFVGIPVKEPRVGEVQPGSAAEKAGIKSGDLIAAIDGAKIETFGDIVKSVSFRGGELLHVTIDRNGIPISLQVVAGIVEESDGFGGTSKRGLLGVSPPKDTAASPPRRLSIPDAISQGTGETWRIISVTFKYLGKLVRGQESSKQIGGPVSIAKMAGDAASSGGMRFAIFIAFLSTSVGLINLFPIPMLDGGHLVYYAIETVAGKPLGKQAQEWGFRVGLSLVAMLMAFGFWNDLTRLFAMIVGG